MPVQSRIKSIVLKILRVVKVCVRPDGAFKVIVKCQLIKSKLVQPKLFLPRRCCYAFSTLDKLKYSSSLLQSHPFFAIVIIALIFVFNPLDIHALLPNA
jgi:hypothetical protein